MRRLGHLTLSLVVLAVLAAPASANGPGYAEPAFTRPAAGGTNFWHWYTTGISGSPVSYCFYYRQGAAPPTFTQENNAVLPTGFSGVTGEPVSASNPGANCATYLQSAPTFSLSLVSLQGGAQWIFCAKEWVKFNNISWQGSAYPVQCQTTTIDTDAPTSTIALSSPADQVVGGTRFTNAQTLTRTITYADATSPPWPDTRICTTTTRDCTTADTFNYDAACSPATALKVTQWPCTTPAPGADGPFHQCEVTWDSAVADAQPNLAAVPAFGSNPVFAPGTGNRSAIACDTITIDRTAPGVTITADPAQPKAGQAVKLTAAATDAGSGPGGAFSWTIPGGNATGPTVTRTFGAAGTVPVTVATADRVGNPGTKTLNLVVAAAAGAPSAPPAVPPSSASGGSAGAPLTAQQIAGQSGASAPQTVSRAGLSVIAPKRLRLKAAKRRLPLALTAPGRGTFRIALRQGRRAVASGSVRVAKAGSLGFRLTLGRRVRPGPATLSVRFVPATGADAVVTVKVRFAA